MKNYRRGWFNESARHSLAAKGVKTTKRRLDIAERRVRDYLITDIPFNTQFNAKLKGLGTDRENILKRLKEDGWRVKMDIAPSSARTWSAFKGEKSFIVLGETDWNRVIVERVYLTPHQFNSIKDEFRWYPTLHQEAEALASKGEKKDISFRRIRVTQKVTLKEIENFLDNKEMHIQELKETNAYRKLNRSNKEDVNKALLLLRQVETESQLRKWSRTHGANMLHTLGVTALVSSPILGVIAGTTVGSILRTATGIPLAAIILPAALLGSAGANIGLRTDKFLSEKAQQIREPQKV